MVANIALKVTSVLLLVANSNTLAQSETSHAQEKAKGSLIIKVVCPNDENLRKVITKPNKGDNFLVRCSKPLCKSHYVVYVSICCYSLTLASWRANDF